MQAKSRLDLSEAVGKGTDLFSISFAKGLSVNFSVMGAPAETGRRRPCRPRHSMHAKPGPVGTADG